MPDTGHNPPLKTRTRKKQEPPAVLPRFRDKLLAERSQASHHNWAARSRGIVSKDKWNKVNFIAVASIFFLWLSYMYTVCTKSVQKL